VYVVQVTITVKPGHEQAAQSIFAGPFRPAISAQPGFKGVEFLKPIDGAEYVLSIAFESQTLQQKWVATNLHTQVWSQMEANFEGYTVKAYNTI
jgi:heme-degrading monooxygenase HmoA